MCSGHKQKEIGNMGLSSEGCSLNRVAGIGVIVEVTFESTLKGVGHADMYREKGIVGPRPMAGVSMPCTFIGWSSVRRGGEMGPARKARVGEESQITGLVGSCVHSEFSVSL